MCDDVVRGMRMLLCVVVLQVRVLLRLASNNKYPVHFLEVGSKRKQVRCGEF